METVRTYSANSLGAVENSTQTEIDLPQSKFAVSFWYVLLSELRLNPVLRTGFFYARAQSDNALSLSAISQPCKKPRPIPTTGNNPFTFGNRGKTLSTLQMAMRHD